MIRLLALAAAGAICALLPGCATSDQPDDPNRVSSIPWNRPERWEGRGVLGGFSPETR